MLTDSFFKRLISFLFSGLFFFVPLFFTSVNSELFEFNKIVLTYGFTCLIVSAWLARMILQKKILFKKTPLDIPLIIFFVSQLASTLLSIDRHTSFWGYYSRFNGGLLSLFAYLLLYWAFVSNCETKDVLKILKTSLASAFIVSVYGILEHFGHSFSCLMFTGSFDVGCWVQDVKNRVFASLGQPNWLATYLAVLIPSSLALILNSKLKIQSLLLPFMLSIALYACLIFTGSRSGFLGLILGLTVFWPGILIIKGNRNKSLIKPFFIFNFALLILNLLFGSPFDQVNKYLHFRSWITENQPQEAVENDPSILISESSDIRKIVWKGAIDIFKHYPIFGSGLETFAYSYYNFRPMEHNHVSEWDFLYNKAHNEYLNYLSTTGAVGLGAYLLFIGAFAVWSVRQFLIFNSKFSNNDKSQNFQILSLALFSGWLSILISNFFGFSVVVVSLYFYLIPAFVFVLKNNESPPPVKDIKISPILLIILSLVAGYLLLAIINVWRADYFYAQGLKLGKQGEYLLSYQNINKAVQLSPNEPVFLNDLSSATANMAIIASVQKEAALANQLLQDSISYSDKALKISPYNLNFYKNRVKVFYTLSTIDPQYLKKAIETVEVARKLAPTDPKLVYNLGLLYVQAEKSEEALAAMSKAIEMKPNYEEARNTLAIFYEDLGMKKEAIEQLEYILQTKKNDQSIIERLQKLQKQ